MDIEILVRLILIGLGIVFLILSAAGAILSLARGKGRVKAQAVGANPLANVTKFLDALTKLIQALTAAPEWLALGTFGTILIFVGAFIPLKI
jgi:stage V sporulation protein SpoVS